MQRHDNSEYVAFISYRKSHTVNADLIQQALINFGYKKRDVFLDKHSIYNGNFKKKISDAVACSKMFILLVTKDCFVSNKKAGETDYFLFEIKEALANNVEILPIFFDNIQSLESTEIIKQLNLLFDEEEVEYLVTRQAVRYDNDYGSTGAITRLREIFNESVGIPDSKDTEEDDGTGVKALPTVITGLVSFLLGLMIFFGLFATAGFFAGYLSNVRNPEKAWTEPGVMQMSAVSRDVIQMQIDDALLKYNVTTGQVISLNPHKNIFEQITLENYLMSISLPVMFKTLSNNSYIAKNNGKSMLLFWVGGSLGILFGYTIGRQIGELAARQALVSNMQEYLLEGTAREKVVRMLNSYYND